MQLKRLYLKEYKLFKDFTYDFPADNQHFVHVLIGINGSGKSTILEAIAEIFSCVVLGEKAKFGFELEYSVINTDYSVIDDVIISSDKNKKPEVNHLGSRKMEHVIEIEPQGWKPKFRTIWTDVMLPESIVIYYSGLSEIMHSIAKPHQEKASKNYQTGKPNLKPAFYYHEPKLFKLLLLSLLSFEHGDVPVFLKEKAKIKNFKRAQIILKKPHWANDTIRNFWGAKGEVRDFLDFLDANSLLPNILENPTNNSSGVIVLESFLEQSIIITILNDDSLFKIKDQLIEEKKLFSILHTMYNDDMLESIEVVMDKEEDGNIVPFEVLSEGEQQAITIKGLTELLGAENTLFLFDEPDTFLHPQWQRNFISEIEQNVELNHQNELCYLIATHSPQILSNAHPDKTSVRIIEEGQLVQQTPKHYGREISSILYNLMGVEERNEVIKKRLSDLFMLIEDEEIEEAESLLAELTELLGDTDADIQNATIQLNYLKDETD